MTTKQLENILKKLSKTEKLAQLTQLNPVCFGYDYFTSLTGPDTGLRMPEESMNGVGSVLNCDNAKSIIEIQTKHMEKNEHKIPLLFMADIIHGFKTIFPIPLAIGCSFSEENMKAMAEISALEGAVSGVHITFSPMADLVRDPRWGRVMESTGEDVYLNSILAAAAVKGYQGENSAAEGKMASCVKHFAAYGAPEGGREYAGVEIGENALHNNHLPAYKAALQAGAKLVMTSFNSIDNLPSTQNRHLLRDVLREQWLFSGVTISDFNSVGELILHGTASSGYEAALNSLRAGVDIEMMSTHYIENADKLFVNSELDEEILNDAVMRILVLKDELGLFENPYKDANANKEKELHLCENHRMIARRIAHESVVMLKNDSVLPLTLDKKIGLVGPFSCTKHVLGGWSAGNTEGVSLYEGLIKKIDKELITVAVNEELGSLQEGVRDISDIPDMLAKELFDCETVIVAVGENQLDTGEGASKTNLRLSFNQEKLIHKLKTIGKKVVMVVFSGRPLEIAPVLKSCDAVLQAWFLGTESGNALADLIVGDISPSGKLSMSFPVTAGQIPVYYSHNSTGRPVNNTSNRYTSRYLDCPNEPLFGFGFGLSYASFTLENFIVCVKKSVVASVKVTNIGKIEGIETIQLYIRDITASVVRPVQQLKGFKRIKLAPCESITVEFEITQEMLCFYHQNSWIFEAGEFEIMIGNSADNVERETIYLNDKSLK